MNKYYIPMSLVVLAGITSLFSPMYVALVLSAICCIVSFGIYRRDLTNIRKDFSTFMHYGIVNGTNGLMNCIWYEARTDTYGNEALYDKLLSYTDLVKSLVSDFSKHKEEKQYMFGTLCKLYARYVREAIRYPNNSDELLMNCEKVITCMQILNNSSEVVSGDGGISLVVSMIQEMDADVAKILLTKAKQY